MTQTRNSLLSTGGVTAAVDRIYGTNGIAWTPDVAPRGPILELLILTLKCSDK